LGQKLVKNPDNAWVRGAAAIEPIVDQGIFARAQKLLAERRVEIPEEEMLMRLRLTLRRRGKLNSHIINTTLGLNHVSSYVKHFGSLRKAYALIGYVSPRDCDWIDTRDFWAAEQSRHATELAASLRTELGLQADLVPDGIGLDVGGARVVSFLVARRLAHRGKDHAAQWKAYRRQISSGLLAVMRLDAANRQIEDYVLLPAPLRSGRYVWLSSDSLRRRQGALYEEKGALFGAIKATLAKTNVPPQPAQYRRKSDRNQAGPKPRASAGGAHGAEIQNRSDERAVVSSEVTIQLRNLG
jgi:hypothetical protein